MKKVAKNISGTPPFSRGSIRQYGLLPSDSSFLTKFSRSDALCTKMEFTSTLPNKVLSPHSGNKALPEIFKSALNPDDLAIKGQAPLYRTTLQTSFPVVSLQTSILGMKAQVHSSEIREQNAFHKSIVQGKYSLIKGHSQLSGNKVHSILSGMIATGDQITFSASYGPEAFDRTFWDNRNDFRSFANGYNLALRQTTIKVNYCGSESKTKNIFKHNNKPKTQSNKHLVLTYK